MNGDVKGASAPIRRRRTSGSPLAGALRATGPAFLTAMIFSFFINMLLFVGPLYMLQVYDRVLSSRSETTLIGLTVIAAILIAVYAMLEMLRSRVLVRAGLRFDQHLSERTFHSVHRGHLRRPASGYSQCLRDLDKMREFLTGSGLITLCDAPWFPIFVAACFMLHSWFGYLALGASALTLLLTLLNELATKKTLGEASRSSAQAGQNAASALRNAEVLYAMGMAGAARKKWSIHHESLLKFQALASDRAGAIIATTKFLRVFMQTAVLGLGAYLVIYREISPGAMIAASILIGRAMQPIELAVVNWKGFVAARASYARLKQLFSEENPEADRMALPRPLGNVSALNVVAAAPQARPGAPMRPVLNGLTFAISAGEAVGVIGPSAAGKSSLARVLLGVWPRFSGSVRLDGFDLEQWDPELLGPHLGYLPQDIELFGGSVAENIARQAVNDASEVDEAKVIEAAGLAGCHEMIQLLSQGYNTEIGDGGLVLSGGQRQRVGLARALYGWPSIVILDEPNANLDSDGEAALLNAINTLRQRGTTTIIITHKINVLAVVDKIMVLKGGSLQMYGPRDEVMAQMSAPRIVKSAEAPPSGAFSPAAVGGSR